MLGVLPESLLHSPYAMDKIAFCDILNDLRVQK